MNKSNEKRNRQYRLCFMCFCLVFTSFTAAPQVAALNQEIGQNQEEKKDTAAGKTEKNIPSVIPELSKTSSLSPNPILKSIVKPTTEPSVSEPSNNIVNIPDTSLKQVILTNLGLPTDTELTQADMTQLTSLILISNQYYSLEGLEYATNLNSIFIGVDDNITDFSPLEGLTKLSYVTLQTMSLTSENFPDLTASKDLTSLSIAKTSVDDTVLPKVAQLSGLLRLNMDDNVNITTIGPLKTLKNLQSLSVQFCGVSDFTVINDFSGLSDLAAYGQNTGVNDSVTVIARTTLNYDAAQQTVFLPFSLMPNRLKNFDGYIPPFTLSNSANDTYLDFNGIQLASQRLQITEEGITVTSVTPAEFQGIKNFEYNARLNNPFGTYAVPKGFGFYAISSGTYLHQFQVVDEGKPITVQYQDLEGNTIAPDEMLKGDLGATYDTKPLELSNYIFKEVRGDASGYFTNQPQTVTYVYEKNFGNIISKYINTEGSKISEDDIQTGVIGGTYVALKKEIKGYNFKEIQGFVSGQFTNQTQTVIFIYEKKRSIDTEGLSSQNGKDNQFLEHQKNTREKKTNKEPALPDLGESSKVLVGLGGIILSFIALGKGYFIKVSAKRKH